MIDEERMDAMVRELADGYQRPPATPRAEIWTRIEAERAVRRGRRARSEWPRVRWTTWTVGLAATLAIGIALGRMTANHEPAPPVTTVVAPEAAEGPETMPAAYRVTADEHFSRVETFLTVFGADAAAGRLSETDFEGPARQLLRRTRLLRGSPVAEDDVMLRALLDDVEFVLLQIASFSDLGDERELGFVEQGINQRSVLLRLRSTLPAMRVRNASEGAL